MFDIIRDNSPGNVPDIQALRVPVKRNLPTPLCFCFNSELDLIAKYALPEKIDILGACPQVRVTERLGEDSAWMLQVYLTVGKIIEEETLNTFTSAQGSSKLAVSQEWTDKLPSKLLTQSFEIIHGVAEASLQMTNAWRPGEGRCRCGSCKKLKFSWKISPTPYPSFFWGCVNYTRQDPQRHDRAQPCSGSLFTCLAKYFPFIATADLTILQEKVNEVFKDWTEKEEVTSDDYKHATQLYGGPKDQLPHTSQAGVSSLLQKLAGDIHLILEERAGLVEVLGGTEDMPTEKD